MFPRAGIKDRSGHHTTGIPHEGDPRVFITIGAKFGSRHANERHSDVLVKLVDRPPPGRPHRELTILRSESSSATSRDNGLSGDGDHDRAVCRSVLFSFKLKPGAGEAAVPANPQPRPAVTADATCGHAGSSRCDPPTDQPRPPSLRQWRHPIAARGARRVDHTPACVAPGDLLIPPPGLRPRRLVTKVPCCAIVAGCPSSPGIIHRAVNTH